MYFTVRCSIFLFNFGPTLAQPLFDNIREGTEGVLTTDNTLETAGQHRLERGILLISGWGRQAPGRIRDSILHPFTHVILQRDHILWVLREIKNLRPISKDRQFANLVLASIG